MDAQLAAHSERSWRYEFDLKVTGDGIKGTVSVTQNYKVTHSSGPVPNCDVPRTDVTTMQELRYSMNVKGTFYCQSLLIEADPHLGKLPNQPSTITSSACFKPSTGSVDVFGFNLFATSEPSSIDNGKVVYKHSSMSTQRNTWVGTFKGESEITVSR